MKKTLSFLFLLLTWHFLSAQTNSISGTITLAEDGSTLPGVTIIVKGTSIGTSTNIDGQYKIQAINPSSTLVFSFIGFKSEEIKIGEKQIINVSLIPETKNLEEVVVTALGVKREKREIGYSSQKINTDELLRSNAPNVISGLSGRAAGVMISQGDGVEGGSTRIVIRGNNNLSKNNQPLIVIDNVPMDNTAGLTDVGRGVDWGNGIADLNPYDIEAYQILEGGAASAQYGERGANGKFVLYYKKKQTSQKIVFN